MSTADSTSETSGSVPAAPDGDAWAGDRVTRWLRQSAGLERQLAPVSELLFDAAAIVAGEAILDIGCGTGPTTVESARRAGATGRVTGLDVSADMLVAAEQAVAAARDEQLATVDWIETDVSTWAPPLAEWDVVLSRFGVMFFPNPGAAARHLAAATRRGGRLAVAVWGRRTESELFELPYRIAMEVRTARGERVESQPVDGGPFSWHDRSVVDALLGGAGWADIASTPHRVHLPFAGGVDAEAAAEAAVDFGPTRLAMAGADRATQAAVQRELSTAFADRLDEHGHVVLEAEIRIITAGR